MDSRLKNKLSADKLRDAVDAAVDQTLTRADASHILSVWRMFYGLSSAATPSFYKRVLLFSAFSKNLFLSFFRGRL